MNVDGFRADVLAGLSQPQKAVPARFGPCGTLRPCATASRMGSSTTLCVCRIENGR